MGSIVFAAPGINRFHLHDRLRRELQQHGHTVGVLSLNHVAHTFWRHQEGTASFVAAGSGDAMRAPLDELAEQECRRLGCAGDGAARRQRHREIKERLARLTPSLLRWFEAQRPDLVLLHQSRSAAHCLVQWVARETGTRVLWTGDGLLPHTLQLDERGLDGDAAASQRCAGDYRVVDNEPALLQACLTNLLARTAPSALSRREIVVPPLRTRLADIRAAMAANGLAGALAAMFAWQHALPPAPTNPTPRFSLPNEPFVAVLLQDPADECLRLDATAPPTASELIAATVAAAARLDPRLQVVVALPWRGLRRREVAGLARSANLHFVPAPAAPEAAVTSVATFTVNHPLASAALLAGTPVLHTGRALYGLRGATTQVATASLPDALPRALAEDHATLRQRFLSWLFGYGHLWCSATHADHNGLAGFVRAIEARLASRSPTGLHLSYRRGPAWPLAADPRGS